MPDGAYRIELNLATTPAQALPPKLAPVKIERGLRGQVAALEKRLAGRPAHPQLSSAEYVVELFRRADRSAISPARIEFARELRLAGEILDALDAGKDAFAARRGDFRKAYRSAVDNTLQPYRLFVPESYDPAKPWPLVVALHGMGGDENTIFDAYTNMTIRELANARGYLVVCPKGREPASMYRGAAETDVLDVIAAVRRDYSIDAHRIYATGHSMGGYGSWSIAMNHPDLFAAIAPVAGCGNPAEAAKIAHVPQYVVHGDNDKLVAVSSSRAMVAAAQKAGAGVKYIEIPGGGHNEVFAPAMLGIFDWFDAHSKPAAAASGRP